MSNITKFPGSKSKIPEPSNDDNNCDVVLICNHCGCMSHFINMDQTIQCANCKVYITPDTSGWKRNLPEEAEEVSKLDDTGGALVVKSLGDETFARKSVLRTLKKWADAGELAFVAAYHDDGTGAHWANIVTKAHREWVVDKLQKLAESVKFTKVEDE